MNAKSSASNNQRLEVRLSVCHSSPPTLFHIFSLEEFTPLPAQPATGYGGDDDDDDDGDTISSYLSEVGEKIARGSIRHE